MRLAQIARKVKVKPIEIRAFIKEEFNLELDKDPNIKLEDSQVQAILEKFKIEEIKEELVVEEVEAVIEDEIEIDPSIDTDLDSLKVVAEDVEEKIEIPDVKIEEVAVEEAKDEVEEAPVESTKKKVGIKHASPEELEELKAKRDEEDTAAAFTAVEVDENAELIAAEVEQLEGLKVVGKIELEDDKETKKMLKEEVELPSSDAIEEEIDELDGDVDTSEFTELLEDATDEKTDAIFAELDAAMDNATSSEVKKVKNAVAAEVKDNVEEEEDSIFKDARGIYHFSSEQRANRRESIRVKNEKERVRIQKEKSAGRCFCWTFYAEMSNVQLSNHNRQTLHTCMMTRGVS